MQYILILSSNKLVKKHQRVNHLKKEYANGSVCDNNCKNRNSLLTPLEIFLQNIQENFSK
jgi:tryptophanyl-tRNA synthetase